MTELADQSAHDATASEVAVRPDGAAIMASAEGELGEFRSLRSDVWRQFRRHKGAMAGVVMLTIIILGCFLGPIRAGIPFGALGGGTAAEQ